MIDAGGGRYANYPDAAPTQPTQYIEGADWQQAGPSPEQLAAAEEQGVPIDNPQPRTQDAADQLNSVRPDNAQQEVPVETGYGTDSQGNPLPAIQAGQETLPGRYTALNETVDAIRAGKPAGALATYGQALDKARQREVQAIGDELYYNITGKENPDQSLLGKLGRAGAAVQGAIGATLEEAVNDPQRFIRTAGTVGPEPIIGDSNFKAWGSDPANQQKVVDAWENGYGGFTGGQAVHQLYTDETTSNDTMGGLQRGLRDIGYDPLTTIQAGLAAASGGTSLLPGTAGKVAGGALKAANVAIDPVFEGALPLAGKAARASGVAGKIANSPVGRLVSENLLQPSQTNRAAGEITDSAERMSGALDDVDANMAAPQANAGAAAPPPPTPTPPGAGPSPAASAPSGGGNAAPGAAAPPTAPGAAPSPGSQPIVMGGPGPWLPTEAAPGQWTVIDPVSGAARPLNPAVDFPEALARMKVAPLADYEAMRDAWFPRMFRNGTGDPNVPKFIDAYQPFDNGLASPAYDNYIDLMASRVRTFGPDIYNDIFNRLVAENRATNNWRRAAQGLDTWENIQLHSGVADPNRAMWQGVVNEINQRTGRPALPAPGSAGYGGWDPARLANRQLPPVRTPQPNVPGAAPTPGTAAPTPGPAAAPASNAAAGTPAAGAATPNPPTGGAPPAGGNLGSGPTAAPNWRDMLTGARNADVDPETLATLDRVVNGMSLGDRLWNLKQGLEVAQDFLNRGVQPGTNRTLDRILKDVEGLVTADDLRTMDRRTLNRVAALRTALELEKDAAFKAAYPQYFERMAQRPSRLGRNVQALKEELPAVVLYNYARIAPFMVQQFLGNTTSATLSRNFGAVGGLYDVGNAAKVYQRARGGVFSDVETRLDAIRRAAGLPVSDTYRLVGRGGQASDSVLELKARQSSLVKRLAEIAAPPWVRDFLGISDVLMRESIGESVLVRGASEARQAVRGNAADRAARFGVRVSNDQIDAAVRAAEDVARRESGQPIYSAPTLRAALEGSGATGADTAKWADRVARDYQAALKQADAAAKQEVNRTAFSFQKTRADELIGGVLFFTYWNLRASKLYARELLRQPATAAAYGRMMQGLVDEAEDKQYPDYLRGWLRLMASEDGFNIYVDPTKAFSTFLTFGELSFRNPDGDMKRLSDLGRMTEWLPGMVNPMVGSLLYAVGAFGADAQAPDITGLGSLNRTIFDIYNAVKVGAGGTPADQAFRRISPNVLNAIASVVSEGANRIFPQLDRVARENPSATWETRVNWLTQQVIREKNPTWTEDQVLAEAANVLGDMESPYVQEAIDRASQQPFAGPDLGLGDVPVLGGLLGGLSQNALGTQARPTQQDVNLRLRRLWEQKPPAIDQQTANQAYLARDIAQSAGPQDIGFERTVDGYYNLASDEQSQIKDVYNNLRYQGIVPGGSIEVAGRTWTTRDVAAMDDRQRADLVEAYLRERGDWSKYQQFKDAQTAYKQQHPELQDYFDFEDKVKSYPGGPERWAEVTRASNPNVDEYIRTQENLNDKNLPGGSNRISMLTDPNIYRAAYGIPSSLYDVPIPPGDTGYFVAGIPTGLTPSQTAELGGGSDGGQQGKGSTYNEETTQQLQDDLANYFGMVAIMDAYDAQVGNAPGTTQRQYVLRVATGDKGYKIPSPVYNQIKDAYGYVLPSKGKLGDYLGWALNEQANPEASTDIQDFLDWDRGQYLQRELAKPQPAAGQPVDVTGGLRAAPVGQQQKVVTMRAAAPGLADPKNQWSALLDVPPMLPLEPLSGYWVGPDRNWQLVQLPDGTQVWVDAALLTAA